MTSEEVAEVLHQQQELRRQYDLMILDVEEALDEGNVPPNVCQQEVEYLTPEFRPLLLELANHTICSLDQDRKLLKVSTELHSAAFSALRDEQGEHASTSDSKIPNSEVSAKELQEGAGGSSEELRPDLSKGGTPDLLAIETKFWDARRIPFTYRRDHFVPVVPDLNLCFLPELSLSVFAY